LSLIVTLLLLTSLLLKAQPLLKWLVKLGICVTFNCC
jgi:hypothetical protein